MKGAIITDLKKLEIQEFPDPKPDGKNVIMKVQTCGICGSDIHMWELGDKPGYKGIRPGHEHVGIVVDPGSRTDLKVGDRITSLPVSAPCGKCTACMEHRYDDCMNRIKGVGNFADGPAGTYAEYFFTAPNLVRKVPDGMLNEEAAMVEPCATPYSAVKDMNIRRGDKVLVFGGGIIGSFAAQWSKYFGADYVGMVEVNEFRGKKNLEVGNIDELFDGKDPELLQKLIKASGGKGFDYVLECTGQSQPLNTAILASKMYARIAIIGVSAQPILFNNIYALFKRARLQAYLCYTDAEFDEVMNLIATKKFDVMRYYSGDCKLEEIEDCFKYLHSPECQKVKIMLQFPRD
ncbi:MAG: alcohol dehydrogenase catalytic domain-containing protein [Clostridia bacterium]|nr:alcohol dehydrogenase catalytic domain-containing protein [Clostridia bacterium]